MDRRTAISLATLALLEAGCESNAPKSVAQPPASHWKDQLHQARAHALGLSLLVMNGKFRADFLADNPGSPAQGASANHPFRKVNPGVYKKMLKYFKDKGDAAATAEIQSASATMMNWANAALSTPYDNPDECPCTNMDYAGLDCEVVDSLLV